MKLYTSQLLPVAATASSAAGAYPATNALTESLARPWNSLTLVSEFLQADLGADTPMRGILLHDCNFSSFRIDTITNAAVTTAGTVRTAYANRFARYRGLDAKNISGRYAKIFPLGSPTDGLAYWRIGAVYLFGAVASVAPIGFGAKINTDHAELRTRLANGKMATAAMGTRFDQIDGSVRIFDVDTIPIGTMLADMRNGVSAMDCEITGGGRESWLWPLRPAQSVDIETLANPKQAEVRFSAYEAV